MGIRCRDCGAVYPLTTYAWVCEKCAGHLEVFGGVLFDPRLIAREDASLWRYRAMLPLPTNSTPVTMGEGWTPLIPIRYDGRDIHCKLDSLNPTGSFKDRGAAVMLTALKALGINNVVEDSSGNAAASLAGYSAYAGLRATIFAPAHASPFKLSQIEMYGATLRKIEGVRENSALAALDAVKHSGAYYASHYYNPYFLAGMETTAWELWEQFGGRAPDAVIMPVGHGTNLLGMYRGFGQLLEQKLIEKLPRLIAAQAALVAPLVTAFANRASEPARVAPARTIAEGIAISQPVHGAELLHILYATNGIAAAASEDQIRNARLKLARKGLFVEPTSATTIAVLELVRTQLADAETIVVCLTGNGLKSPLS